MDYASTSICGSSDDASEIGLENDVSLVCNLILGPSFCPPPPIPQVNNMDRLAQIMERLIVSTERHNKIDDRLYGDIDKVLQNMMFRFDGLVEMNRYIMNQLRSQSNRLNSLAGQLNTLVTHHFYDSMNDGQIDAESDD
uniref:Uncharacterized protein n=1 Tax=Tetranychus urticae TaxID=32264 RepID=T1KKS7_TETUR